MRRAALLTAALALVLAGAGCGSSGDGNPRTSPAAATRTSSSAAPTTSAPASPPTRPRTTAAPRRPSTSHRAPVPTPVTATHRPTPVAPPPPTTGRLPLAMPTGDATRVLTVTAPGTSSTAGTLQAWQRTSSGWARMGGPVPARLGSDGLSSTPSETRSATPIGSFTLTQAFGRLANPGTGLPYLQTTPADWWISQPGPLYNTLQHCAGSCGFTQGDPNEHLYYETPYYDYAVVIDYNRSPVVQGAGSAFFLHVTDGTPTAGCVAIPSASLVTLMRWLTPAAHPRILIGVG